MIVGISSKKMLTQSTHLTDMRKSVPTCMEQMSNNDDDLNCIGKLNELKINGIEHSN